MANWPSRDSCKGVWLGRFRQFFALVVEEAIHHRQGKEETEAMDPQRAGIVQVPDVA